jgi:hypothetical protein
MTCAPLRSRGEPPNNISRPFCFQFPPIAHRITRRKMAPASSFVISGIFFLSDGTRSTSPSYYATYQSALDFLDTDDFIGVSVRKYTPPSEPLYANETVVFLVAKAVLPAGEDAMLDAIHCTPFQLSWDDCKDCLPLIPTCTASVTGTIGAITNVGSIRFFAVNASEYVRDERRGFTVQLVFSTISGFGSLLIGSNFRFQFEAESGRWKNLRLPSPGSTIIATGAFNGVANNAHGEAVLTLLDVSFGTPETVSASPTRTIGHRRIAK